MEVFFAFAEKSCLVLENCCSKLYSTVFFTGCSIIEWLQDTDATQLKEVFLEFHMATRLQ